jgi:hypothetical protein
LRERSHHHYALKIFATKTLLSRRSGGAGEGKKLAAASAKENFA